MMEEDLRGRLLAVTAIATLVGKRVDWIERPQATALPALTLQLISPGRAYTHDGPDTLEGPRVQFDCWGATYAQAKLLARAVTAAIEPPATFGTTAFGPAFLDGSRDLPPEDVAGGARVYRVSQDFIIWHEGV